MVSAAGAAEPTSSTVLLLMLLVSPPRLPVSSPRLFPSGSVPSGPGQEGGHNAARPRHGDNSEQTDRKRRERQARWTGSGSAAAD